MSLLTTSAVSVRKHLHQVRSWWNISKQAQLVMKDVKNILCIKKLWNVILHQTQLKRPINHQKYPHVIQHYQETKSYLSEMLSIKNLFLLISLFCFSKAPIKSVSLFIDIMSRILPRTLLTTLYRQNLYSSPRNLSTSRCCSNYKPEPWEEIYTAEAIGGTTTEMILSF